MSDLWQSLPKIADGADIFNKSTTGGSMLDLGVHENVTIEAAEAKDFKGSPAITVTFSRDGKSLRDTFWLLKAKDSDEYSVRIRHFVGALTGDPLMFAEFFNALAQYGQELVSGLVGLTLNIEISAGTRGYSLIGSTGAVQIVDASTNEFYMDLGDELFTSFTEANEVAKAAGYYRAFPTVSRTKAGTGVDRNVQAIRAVISALSSPAKSVAPIRGTRMAVSNSKL